MNYIGMILDSPLYIGLYLLIAPLIMGFLTKLLVNEHYLDGEKLHKYLFYTWFIGVGVLVLPTLILVVGYLDITGSL